MLRRTCNACLQELRSLREQISMVDGRVSALEGIVTELAKVAETRAGDGSAGERPLEMALANVMAAVGLKDNRGPGALQCLIVDKNLHDVLLGAVKQGEIRFEVRDLLKRLRKSLGGDEDDEDDAVEECLRTTILGELSGGGLRATVFKVGSPGGPRVIVTHQIEDIKAAVESELGGPMLKQAVAVVLTPVFQGACWGLLEAVIRWCRMERLVPTVELVVQALRSLVAAEFAKEDLLTLLKSAPPGQEATTTVERGEVVIQSLGPEDEAFKRTKLPVAAYCPSDEDRVRREAAGGNPASMELAMVSEQLRTHWDVIRALGEGDENAQMVSVLNVLAPIRAGMFAAALTLPSDLRGASGGILHWALSRRSFVKSRQAVPPTPPPAAPPLAHSAAAGSADTPSLAGVIPAKASETEKDQSPGPRALGRVSAPVVTVPAPNNKVEGPSPSSATDGSPGNDSLEQDEEHQVTEEDQIMGSGLSDAEESEGVTAGKSLNILEQQAAFIECFREELYGKRTLLLSQLNNLYKMRSSGEELPYKVSGYEKLRDFLLDIPGLSLMGRGNRMQVQLAEPAKLEAFQESIRRAQQEAQEKSAGMQTPQFRMPKPLPEALLQRLYDLFVTAENQEIPLRNFLNIWNARHPTEQLGYRALGFRDVRGLLSQVPFIEKVGGKSDAKYVLKRTSDNHVIPFVGSPSSAQDAESDLGAARQKLPQLPGAIPPGPVPADGSRQRYDPGPVNSGSRVPLSSLLPYGQQVSPVPPIPAPTAPPNLRGGGGMGMYGHDISMSEWAAPALPPGSLGQRGLMPMKIEATGVSQGAQDFMMSLREVLDPRSSGGAPLSPQTVRPSSRHAPMAPGQWGDPMPDVGLSGIMTPSVYGSFGAPLVPSMPPPRSMLSNSGSRSRAHVIEPEEEDYPGYEEVSRGYGNLPPSSMGNNMTSKKYVSSPGALSSDGARDMSIDQGKFDMAAVFQMQLRQDTPCLVCDISRGQVMVANPHCEEFFEAREETGRLVDSDLFRLIQPIDREKFSTCLAYLMVTERTKMQPQHVRVITLRGQQKYVRVAGSQLIGMWWQLDFTELQSMPDHQD